MNYLRTRRVAASLLPLLLACTACVGAQAQPARLAGSLTFENDVMAQSDDNYTNGIQIERVRENGEHDTPVFRALCRAWKTCSNNEVLTVGDRVGQLMYTPTDLENPSPQPHDRPWAGLLYFQRTYDVFVPGEESTNLTLLVGVIGPHSYAEQAQKFVHKHITDSPYPRGWHNQVSGAVGLNVVLEKRRAVWSDRPVAPDHRWVTSLAWRSRVAAGNVMTFAGIGGSIALSNTDIGLAGHGTSDIIIKRARTMNYLRRPGTCLGILGLRCMVFGDVEVRAIAHNVFLDGNWGRDDPLVDRRPVVADLAAGVKLGWPGSRWYVQYKLSQRSREFKSPVPVHSQRWGAITVGYDG